MLKTIANDLQRAVAEPCPAGVIWTTFLLPFVIAYLVHFPNTRTLRIGIWAFDIFCLTWVILAVQAGPIWSLRAAVSGITCVIGSGMRWAFSHDPPAYHPLPRRPLYPSLRGSSLFKAFNLVYSAHRHLGIAPYSAPLKPDTRRFSRPRAILYHLIRFLMATFLLDLASFPPIWLAPETFGSVNQVGGNFEQWMTDLSTEWHLPWLLVRIFFVICYGAMTHFGMTSPYHLLALIGITSGVDLPEEWPPLTHQPPLSTSLNELWGHRWHQAMRDLFLLLAKPFEVLPRPLYMIAVFTVSGLFHVVLYYPREQDLVIYPYMLFYSGCGVACVLERAYRRVTGRRVGGVWGWIWTWTVIYVLSIPMVDYEFSSGWSGTMRNEFSINPHNSLVLQLFHALGWTAEPEAFRQIDKLH